MAVPPEVPTPAPALGVRIAYGQASDPGRDPAKAVNEDSCGYAPTRLGHLFVVCDGMGGHLGGQRASDTAIRTVFADISAAPPQTSPAHVMHDAIARAGAEVFALGGPPAVEQRPGATCVAILLGGRQAHMAHVGDSRAYRIRGGSAERLTRDHSMVQEMLDKGLLTAEEAVDHPDSNKITRALGMAETVEVQVRAEPIELLVGDLFLLCSDGLTDMMSDTDIVERLGATLEREGPQASCEALVALANERGGYDNITVQVVQVLGLEPTTGPTIVQTPLGAVAPEADGAKAAAAAKVSETVVQPPAFADMHEAPTIVRPPTGAVSTTVPEPPAQLATPAPAPPQTPSEDASEQTPLLPLVLTMGGVILLLLVLLLWALFYR